MNKDKLKQYIETKREIKIIEEKIEYLKQRKTSIKSQIMSDMPKNFNNNKNDVLGELLGEIEELIEIYNTKYMKLIKQQREIEEVIDNLEEATQRNIMRLRYLEGYTWEKICVEMNYSWRQIHRLHSKILEENNLGGLK